MQTPEYKQLERSRDNWERLACTLIGLFIALLIVFYIETHRTTPCVVSVPTVGGNVNWVTQ